MEIIPVSTRRMQPPQDDLRKALAASNFAPKSKDVICVSSKVVAIDEGTCQMMTREEKRRTERAMADLVIERPYWSSPLTIVHNTFLGNAGLDESNGDGYVIALPYDPFESAKKLWQWIRDEYECEECGVIIVDSRSLPFRYGASGVALSWWGIEPLVSHVGSEDLFGRALQYERSNIVDGLAAAATVVMGETDESTPVTLIRNIPKLSFTDVATRETLFCPPQDDTFRVLYEDKL